MLRHFYKHSRCSLNVFHLQRTYASHIYPFLSMNYGYRSGSFGRFQCYGYAASPNYKNQKLPMVDESLQSHPSSWTTYVVPAALLMFAGAGTVIHYNDKRRAIPKGSSQGTENERNAVKGPAIGGPFKLIDMNYNEVTDRDLRGNWVLMYFGYTSSPDVGPQELQKMAEAIDIIESKQNLKILPVFITIDPQRDSPSHLQAYLQEFDPRIIGLTGPVAAIRQIAQEYRVFFKKFDEDGEDYLIQSSHNMYLLDPNMEIVRSFGLEYDADQLAEVILNDVNRASTSDKKASN